MDVASLYDYSEFRAGKSCYAYNEAAFRHFLEVDRRRVRRSTRSLLLVLASLRRGPGKNATLSETAAAALFLGLGECVREVDYVGWYRRGSLVGAVLAQGSNARDDMSARAVERIVPAVRKRLSSDQARSLRIRIVRIGHPVRN